MPKFTGHDLRRCAMVAALALSGVCVLFFIIDPDFASYLLKSLLRGSPVE
jgi:hypothetical protein